MAPENCTVLYIIVIVVIVKIMVQSEERKTLHCNKVPYIFVQDYQKSATDISAMFGL